MADDFRSLCAELADSVELLLEMRPVAVKPLSITEGRLVRARAALKQSEFEWRDIGDGQLVQVQRCHSCGVCPANVDDCGHFGDPECPYFGIGSPKLEANSEAVELASELRHFINEYQQMRGLDPENIYSIHPGHAEKEAHLRVSRLARCAQLLSAAYQVKEFQ